MKKQIIVKISRFIYQVSSLCIKTVIILTLYIARALKIMFGWIESVLEFICLKANILTVISTPDENIVENEAKYTENDVKIMANKLPENIETISDISSFYNISYRQAKKIKDYMNILQNSPDIHNQYAV